MTNSTNQARLRPMAPKTGNPLKKLTRRAAAAAAALTLVTGAAAAASAQELGVDVSRYQHPSGTSINWAAVKADGVSFAFIKATEGTSYTNPYFAGDWAATRSVGLFHGAYHFARPSGGTAAAQARYFVSRAGRADQAGDLPPVLDLEVTGGLGVSALRTWTSTWLKTVESLTGRKPIVYTSPSFWEKNMGNSTAFTAYPLWIAHYGVTAPRVPGGWATWTFWQGNSSGRVTGISGDVDMNAFHGTYAQLAALARTKVSQPTPTPTPTPTPAPTPTPTPTEPSARIGTTVTFALSRSRVYAGQNVTFAGNLTGADGAPVAGRTAFLNAQPSGQTTWRRVATMTTDTAGHYATTLKATSAASYRVTVPATDTHTRAVSQARSLAIIPKTVTRLSLAAGRTTIPSGRAVKLYGHLASTAGAGINGKPVKYFVRPAGATRWTLVGTSTSAAPSGWHQRFVRPRRTSTYKAVYVGALRYTAARSALVKVTVRR